MPEIVFSSYSQGCRRMKEGVEKGEEGGERVSEQQCGLRCLDGRTRFRNTLPKTKHFPIKSLYTFFSLEIKSLINIWRNIEDSYSSFLAFSLYNQGKAFWSEELKRIYPISMHSHREDEELSIFQNKSKF